MSDRMTAISLPGTPVGALAGGWAEWGRTPTADMIARFRRMAEKERDAAQAVLDAADEDFRIETYLGPHRQAKREIIQLGRKS